MDSVLQKVIGEYQANMASHSPVWFVTFKALGAAEFFLMLPKYYKTFDL